MLSSTDPRFGYCPPPPQMIGVVTAHLRECRYHNPSGSPILVPIGSFRVGSISPGCQPIRVQCIFPSTPYEGGNPVYFFALGNEGSRSGIYIYIYIETKSQKVTSRPNFRALCNPQALHHPLSRLRTFLTLTGGLLAPLLTEQRPSLAHNQTLPRVAAVRGRVLCARCHGENDDTFYFCQWCAVSSSVAHDKPEAGTLHVNTDTVRTRFTQFTTAANASAPAARRDATALLIEQFLLSRASGGSQRVQTAHSRPTSSNPFAGWMPAGHDAEHQSMPYTVQRWALRHLILTPPRPATAPCATLMNPCEPTTSPSYRCPTNATWASSRIGAITYVRVTPHAAP